MVNIFYSYTQNGPGKVINNLKQGLRQLGIEYAENTMQYEFNIFLSLTPEIIKCDLKKTIVGPNIGFDNTVIQEQKYKFYIAPSEWVKKLFVDNVGLNEKKILIWPVGIDTQKFNQLPSNKIYDFLIYFKRRDRNELRQVIEFLQQKNKTFTIVEYGHYDENSFIESISNSKYGIVIDGTESQGIAIQEMMSCDLPLFVWDVKYWADMGEENKCPATSVPYFDDRCGLKFYSIEEFEQNYEIFINSNYYPRDFILENLSIEVSTKKIINTIIS